MIFPPEGIRLSSENFHAVGDVIRQSLNGGQSFRIRLEPWQEKRSLSQNNMFHGWMRQLSQYLIDHGRPYCSPEWCKEAMKSTFLGFEETEYIDVKSGARIVRERLKRTSTLKSGEMYMFMTQVHGWCLGIGCLLKISENSEYFQNMRKQVQ